MFLVLQAPSAAPTMSVSAAAEPSPSRRKSIFDLLRKAPEVLGLGEHGMVADEEKKIREDPKARVTDIPRKAFGR